MDFLSHSCSILRQSTEVLCTDSPPSLIYSEFTSEDIDEIMASVEKEDASTTMGTVLGHLDRIVEHLREKGENDAANHIAQSTYTMIDTFNSATASWDMENYLMNPPIMHHRDPTPSGRTVAVREHQAIAGASWATVAATAATDNSQMVKCKPGDVLHRTAPTETVTAPSGPPSERDRRVVWVQPWDASEPLGKITATIVQGPLLSIAYSENDHGVCIIFQHAQHARSFLQENDHFSEHHGHGIFGATSQILGGLPYPYDEALHRMGPPANERRRLTFARSQLFTGNMNEAQFRKDLYDLAGKDNVELVWLFNSGNATAVFSGTCIARLVRDEFRKRGRLAGPFKDIQVSFSHDPCERPMHLVTQMHNGQNTHRVQNSNSHGYGHNNPTSQPGGHGTGTIANVEPLKPASPNQTRFRPLQNKRVDSDGWQTVARKR